MVSRMALAEIDATRQEGGATTGACSESSSVACRRNRRGSLRLPQPVQRLISLGKLETSYLCADEVPRQ